MTAFGWTTRESVISKRKRLSACSWSMVQLVRKKGTNENVLIPIIPSLTPN